MLVYPSAHGLREDGVLRQHYGTDSLDASTLLAAVFGFLPADDRRLRASVLAIAEELTEHGFVLRYRTEETDDGLSGQEGTFLICSFWLVTALASSGSGSGRATSWSGCCASTRLLPPGPDRGRGTHHPGRAAGGAAGMIDDDVVTVPLRR